jgi:hypothetical protein
MEKILKVKGIKSKTKIKTRLTDTEYIYMKYHTKLIKNKKKKTGFEHSKIGPKSPPTFFSFKGLLSSQKGQIFFATPFMAASSSGKISD